MLYCSSFNVIFYKWNMSLRILLPDGAFVVVKEAVVAEAIFAADAVVPVCTKNKNILNNNRKVIHYTYNFLTSIVE